MGFRGNHQWYFFLIHDKNGKEDIKNKEKILDFFEKLKDNMNKNKEAQLKNIIDKSNIIKRLNTLKQFKEILFNNASYFIDDEEMKNYNSENLYQKIGTDTNLIKKIITYYNIHFILNNFYLTDNTIIEKQNNNNKISYFKIKKLSKIKQINSNLFVNNDSLNCYFDIEYEPIIMSSFINFYLNVIDLQKATKKYNYNNDKYKKYNTNIFYENSDTNRSEYVYYDPNIDYNIVYNNFNNLINNDYYLKKNNVKEYKDLFTYTSNFKYIQRIYKKEENKDDNKYINDIRNFFIKKFFLKTKNILYLNKFAEIYNVKEKKNTTTEKAMDKVTEDSLVDELGASSKKAEVVDTKEERKEGEDKKVISKFINRVEMRDIRYFEYYTYEVFLDVEIFYKEKKDEIISLNTKFLNLAKCYDKAEVIDNIFYKLLKSKYPSNFFKKQIYKINEKPTEEKDIKQETNTETNEETIEETNEETNKEKIIKKDKKKDKEKVVKKIDKEKVVKKIDDKKKDMSKKRGGSIITNSIKKIQTKLNKRTLKNYRLLFGNNHIVKII